MALTLLSHEISDLCIGKPPLRCLSVSTATVADAIAALKSSDEPFLSVWNCNHDETDDNNNNNKCECLGKICMADIICYLSKFDTNVLSLSSAFDASVSVLLPKSISLIVVHVQSSCKLIEAIDLIIKGAQNLIVPIQTRSNTKRRQQKQQLLTRNAVVSLDTTTTTHKNSSQFCWITQEDIIRFLLDSITVFSPLPSVSISDLGVINSTHTVLAVDYYSSAVSAVSSISRAISDQISVAVIDGGFDQEDPRKYLIGEISPMTLACCDETAAAAVATLSAGDLMSYIDGSGPPESLVRVVRNRLEDKGMLGLISLVDSLSLSSGSSSSSDEESPTGKTRRTYGRSVSNAARMARKSVAIVCNRESSLMAVMIQAIAHRVSYVWVIDEDDGCLVGMVTFVDILKLFRGFLDDVVN